MLAAHHDATMTRLRAHPILATRTHDVIRVTEAGDRVRDNYVVVATSFPLADDNRLASGQTAASDALFEVVVQVTAVDLAGLNLYTDAVCAQLMGHALVVPGRRVAQMERTDMFKPEYDAKAHLLVRDVVFEASSSRA